MSSSHVMIDVMICVDKEYGEKKEKPYLESDVLIYIRVGLNRIYGDPWLL